MSRDFICNVIIVINRRNLKNILHSIRRALGGLFKLVNWLNIFKATTSKLNLIKVGIILSQFISSKNILG